MRKLYGVLLGCFCLWGMCISCQKQRSADGNGKTLPASKGLPYELLLVVDEPIWKSEAGDSLRKVVEGSMPGLPQHEAMFRLLRIFPQHFTRMYVTMRNILVVKIDETLKTPKIGVARDVEATPQWYVSVETPDMKCLGDFLMRNKERITEVFVNAELSQEAFRLRKKYNKEVDEASRDIFSWEIRVPVELAALKKRESFLWASTHKTDQDMNYVCYAFPWDEKQILTESIWVEKRDSAMKRNIPGSTSEQWMTTTKEKGHPLVECRLAHVDGKVVAYEMRGLWDMHKGGLGGPFVSLAYPDSAGKRMIVAEGFIYSPRTGKRDLVRRMEAAIRTIRPVERRQK